jgi:hypothetical protein
MPARSTTVVVLALALATAGAIPAEAARPSASAATLTAAADASEGVDTKAPWFCHNLDCPRYTVLESTDDYELREYEAASWVSTDVSAYAYALAARTGFQVRCVLMGPCCVGQAGSGSSSSAAGKQQRSSICYQQQSGFVPAGCSI